MVTENYFMKKYYYMALLYTGETHTHTRGEDGERRKTQRKKKIFPLQYHFTDLSC